MTHPLGPFHGIRVIESVYATAKGDPVTRRRSWRERLLRRPWRPWKATETHTPMVPTMFTTNDALIVHPALMPELRRLMEEQR